METIYLSKLCILACIVAFLLVTSCPASLGLIPYSSPNQYISEPPQKARKLDLSPQSCELICYNATNPAEPSNFNNHINFVCGSDGFTYLNFEELECVRKSCSRDIRFWRYGRCPRIQSLFSLDFRKQETQDEDVVNQKENQIRLPNIDRSLLKYFSREQISPNNCNHAEARPGGSGQIVHQESLVFPSPSSTKDDRGEGTPMFLRPFHRQGKKICLPDECGCPEEFRPICGSDSVTYGSECLLKCNLECNPDVVKYHDGHCGKVFEKSTCLADECGCPNDFQPVCGSDNVTYGNRCLLECNKNCSPDVVFNYAGYCGRLFFPSGSLDKLR